MSETRIQLTPEALATLRKMSQMQDIALGTMCQVFDKQNALTVSRIQQKYLSFPKSGPPVEIGCRVQSNRLRSSVWAAPAQQVAMKVQSSIGSNVTYAAIQEFGGTIHHPAREGTVKLRTTKGGTLIGQRKNARLAVFAGKQHKQFKEVAFQGKAYDVEMPARAPFTRGIVDRLNSYGRAVSKAIGEAWGQ